VRLPSAAKLYGGLVGWFLIVSTAVVGVAFLCLVIPIAFDKGLEYVGQSIAPWLFLMDLLMFFSALYAALAFRHQSAQISATQQGLTYHGWQDDVAPIDFVRIIPWGGIVYFNIVFDPKAGRPSVTLVGWGARAASLMDMISRANSAT